MSGNNGRKVRTFQLLIQASARCDGEGADKLFEIDGSVLVLVENVENKSGKLVRVASGEELAVNSLELLCKIKNKKKYLKNAPDDKQARARSNNLFC